MRAPSLTGHELDTRAAATYEKYDREYQADHEQDPGDIGSGAGDARKAEHSGDQRHHQETRARNRSWVSLPIAQPAPQRLQALCHRWRAAGICLAPHPPRIAALSRPHTLFAKTQRGDRHERFRTIIEATQAGAHRDRRGGPARGQRATAGADRARTRTRRRPSNRRKWRAAIRACRPWSSTCKTRPLRVSKLVGMEVQSRSGDNLGEVQDVARNAAPGQDMQLIVATRRHRGRRSEADRDPIRRGSDQRRRRRALHESHARAARCGLPRSRSIAHDGESRSRTARRRRRVALGGPASRRGQPARPARHRCASDASAISWAPRSSAAAATRSAKSTTSSSRRRAPTAFAQCCKWAASPASARSVSRCR